MDLEIRTLDLRYETLRRRPPIRERRLLASLGDVGQQTPIVVVRDGNTWVVVDGYKRVRALRRLGQDTVRALAWDLEEADALVLERALRCGDSDSAVEQGWLLHELSTRFALGRDELARRFDRTPSWISRRLALVEALPGSVQAHVRSGAIGPHAAMRHLVPLARANSAHCVQLADALASSKPTTRALADLHAAYLVANAAARERLVASPLLALRARAETRRERATDRTPLEHLFEEMRGAGACASRALARLSRGAVDGATDAARADVERVCRETYELVAELLRRCEPETRHAG